ncbi:MAG: RCC1 domain-containing protein [Acidobacteriota bacterium]
MKPSAGWLLVAVATLCIGCGCRESPRTPSVGVRPDTLQLGGEGDTIEADSTASRQSSGERCPITLDSGAGQSCAVAPDGSALCWGRTRGGWREFPPRRVVNVEDAIEVGAGEEHACAMREAGIVVCWGLALWGQLGCGDERESSSAPCTVTGLDSAAGLSVGLHSSCAWTRAGDLWCWGRNSEGQLGVEAPVHHAAGPVRVGIEGVSTVSVGAAHACAVRRAGGSVWCWGWNECGGLGDGTTDNSGPVKVAGVEDAVSVAAGRNHTCAVLARGDVMCWGDRSCGQLGDGTMREHCGGPPECFSWRTATKVSGLGRAQSVSAGQGHTCALLEDGSVWCWGDNRWGQLGDGTLEPRARPVRAKGVVDAVEVAAGQLHTCVALQDGTVRCWGDGFDVEPQEGTAEMLGGLSEVRVRRCGAPEEVERRR